MIIIDFFAELGRNKAKAEPCRIFCQRKKKAMIEVMNMVDLSNAAIERLFFQQIKKLTLDGM